MSSLNLISSLFQLGGPWMWAILAVGLGVYGLLILESMGNKSDREIWIRTLITAAPLLGLLGTVSGMIEALSSLSETSITNGLGSGISQALITTQYGLSVAVPALLWERVLARRKESTQT